MNATHRDSGFFTELLHIIYREWLGIAGIEPIVIDSLPGSTPDLSVLIVVGKKQESV